MSGDGDKRERLRRVSGVKPAIALVAPAFFPVDAAMNFAAFKRAQADIEELLEPAEREAAVAAQVIAIDVRAAGVRLSTCFGLRSRLQLHAAPRVESDQVDWIESIEYRRSESGAVNKVRNQPRRAGLRDERRKMRCAGRKKCHFRCLSIGTPLALAPISPTRARSAKCGNTYAIWS